MTTDNTNKDEVKQEDTGDWEPTGLYKIPSTREELRAYLHGAMSLELSTLPMYLQAWFSVKETTTETKAARAMMKIIVVEEMLHMNIVSNLILSIFGDEKLPVICEYNINYEKNGLPQNIRPDLKPIYLNKYSQKQLFTFTNVECETLIANNDKNNKPYPYCPGKNKYADVYFDKVSPQNTIGEFYNALGKGLQNLSGGDKPAVTFGFASRQFWGPFSGIDFPVPEILKEKNTGPKITSYDFAAKLIRGIIEQGEGFDIPSLAKKKKVYMTQDSDTKKWTKVTELSHFLRFVELLTGYEIISTEPQLSSDSNQFCIRFTYDIDGAKYKFPFDDNNIYKQTEIKETGLNAKFADLLKNLQSGLNGNSGDQTSAYHDMDALNGLFQSSAPTYSNWQVNFPDPTTVPQLKKKN